MTSNNLINLGLVNLHLPNAWTLHIDTSDDGNAYVLSRTPMIAKVRIYSAVSGAEQLLEDLYETTFNYWKSYGVHVDDLADEFDFEMVCEVPEEFDDSGEFLHIYFKLIDDIILEVTMEKYLEEDEEAMREILTKSTRGQLENRFGNGELIPIEIDNDNWDRIGRISVVSWSGLD